MLFRVLDGDEVQGGDLMARLIIWAKEETVDEIVHDVQFFGDEDDWHNLAVVNDHIFLECRNKLAIDLIEFFYKKYKDAISSIKCQIYGNWKPSKEAVE